MRYLVSDRYFGFKGETLTLRPNLFSSMRSIATIPHPSIGITVFAMNEKYIIKLEAGPMEQVFKISQAEIGGPDAIPRLLDEAFLKKALERFNEMYLSFKAARERL